MNCLEDRMESEGFSAYDLRNKSMGEKEAFQLSRAISDVLGNEGRVWIGRDCREHSHDLKDAVIEGVAQGGSEPLYIGFAPTDMVSYFASEEGAGGICVTASHMPPEYRGLKPLNEEGRIFTNEEYNAVLDNYEGYSGLDPEIPKIYSPGADMESQYIDAVTERYEELFEKDLEGLSVVVDPGNSVGSLTLPRALYELGVNEEDLGYINMELDSQFPGRGPNPTKSSLEELRYEVLEQDADLGIALDGDADRAVFVNDKGEKVSGHESLALLSGRYLEKGVEEGRNTVACSANISNLVGEWIDEKGGEIDHQPVGAVFTAEAALEDEEIIYGGQPNGHLLDPEFTPYDSGTVAGVAMAGILQERDKDLSEIQQELPDQNIKKGDIEIEEKRDYIKEVEESFREKGYDMSLHGNKDILRITGGEKTFTVRPSGSEDIVRITVERK